MKKKYERDIAADYQRVHCRDERIFAADEEGFTSSCKCATVTRPWTELLSFAENNTHLQLNTQSGGLILPKSAFASEAEITEFRALAD